MMRVIDGSSEMPSQIAQSLGYIGDAITDQEVQQAVDSVLQSNAAIVDKIVKTGKTGPVMALVGKVMQMLNKRGDPKQILILINDKL